MPCYQNIEQIGLGKAKQVKNARVSPGSARTVPPCIMSWRSRGFKLTLVDMHEGCCYPFLYMKPVSLAVRIIARSVHEQGLPKPTQCADTSLRFQCYSW